MAPAPGPSSPLPETAGPSSSNSMISSTGSVATGGLDNRASVVTAASAAAGPKTCVRCGRHIENSEIGPDDGSVAHAVPSPSSVAFAATPSSSSQISSILAGSTSTGTESMALDEDRHQICSTCAASNSSREVLIPITASRERRTRSSTIQQHNHSVQEEEEDTDMSTAQGTSETDIITDTLEANHARARDASVHPWRMAPWARTQSDSLRTNVETGAGPLSISLVGIGAGGDAEQAQEDFPPLPQSPQASQSIASPQSPRLPVSPNRTRNAASPPTTPSALARRTSFSRSQTGPATSAIPTSPIVNFPSRGRNRAGSTSSSSAITPAPHLGRRTSSRRLSRSSSSQGPTTTAFAEGVVAVMAEGERIEEDPFGPSAMTRPRLSTLTPLELASSAVSNTELPDIYKKDCGPQDGLEKTRKKDEEGKEEELKQRLIWFRYNRPDPRRDISKMRCLSRGRGCLFPGSTFNGTQKSGRMSYDVTVQIVNVDMASSHLCGYLNIRGLTDDWPELTTYFDAEIIGMRYGFLTGKWGAMEADDMKHWSRFTPFRPLKNSLIKPGLRFNHMNKPFVFMRWKERFLVPDHRVRDINGASFAGFYYVCVELGEDEAGQAPLAAPLSPTIGGPASPPIPPQYTRQRSASNRRRMMNAGHPPVASGWTEESATTENLSTATADTAMDEGAADSVETAPYIPTMGRMSGFYFHEHSEPYQQLTLQHVTERSSSTFELR